MKKITTTLLLLTAINFYSQAQWVTIPDANFVTWLNNNGYSSCMSGNQMDTTCPSVINADTIRYNGPGGVDLTGIQYFDNLKYLDISYSSLTSLPPLPGSLTWLSCSLNQLTSLPALPGGLVELHCGQNPLNSLPPLPNSLKEITADQNNLTSLPTLPTGLLSLFVQQNLLTSLPTLPNTIGILEVFDNQLTSLPALPDSLFAFACGGNQLTSLPALPTGLVLLACDNNQLANLPPLPGFMYQLNCSFNPITSLPELPDSIDILTINGCPITCLPLLKQIGTLNFSNTNITCKPNIGNVTNSTPSLASLPLCQPGTPCALPNYVAIPDTNFGTWLNTNGYSTCMVGNNTVGWLMDTTCAAVVNANSIICQNRQIRDLTGISYFDNLATLDCDTNLLATLPALPARLTTLQVSYNLLMSLPALTDSLYDFTCNNNLLTNMPTLPQTLYNFYCHDNQLTSLPTLPPHLAFFVCRNNQLTALPNVPDTMCVLDISNNPITCFPSVKWLCVNLWFSNTLITCLPYYPGPGTSIGVPRVRSFNLCSDGNNPNGCAIAPVCQNFKIDSNITTNSSCIGNSGSIAVNASGGRAPYSFSYAPPDLVDTVQVSGSGISGWSYVGVSSAIGIYPAMKVTGTGIAPGTVVVNVDGNIVYLDKLNVNSVSGVLTFIGTTSAPQTGNSFSSLSPSTYTVFVKDSNSCFLTDTVVVSTMVINASVTNNGDGIYPDTLDVNVAGGCPPYTYNWSNGSSIILSGGTYYLTLTDNCGCTAGDSIVVGSAPFADAGPDQNSCSGDCITLGGTPTASGGTPPYTYTWNNGAASVANPTVCPVATTTYIVTVTDNLGASATGTVTVSVNPVPVIDSIITTDASCSIGNASILIYASGGANPYTYSINGGPTQAQNLFSGLSAGPYQVTVYDDNGCYDTASVNVLQSTGPSLQVTSATSGALPDTLCASVTGGTPPILYNWSGNVSGLPNMCFELLSGAFSITVEDANGCTASYSTNSLCLNQCVWPGDADYNGIADNNDLLPIGLAYGKNGPARAQQDINWYAHPATDWIDTITTTGSGSTGNNIITVASSAGISLGMEVSGTGIATGAVVTSLAGTTLALNRANTGTVNGTLIFTTPSISSGVNSKQIDCDGNGTIDANDTLAILQNFGLTHAKTGDQRPWRMTDPSMYVELTPDTTHAGDTMYANITLGDIGIPANDVYGLAFTFNYDASVVDSTRTAVTFGNSWLGTATDKISLAKNFHPLGQIKCALTRIDHATRSGFGQIGQVSFVITTDNINGKNLAYHQMNVYITDLVMIDNLGNYMTVNEGKDSSLVEFEPAVSAVNGQSSMVNFKIQPNPANDEVQIAVTDELIGGEMKVLDVGGRVLSQTVITTRHSSLATRHLSQGLYFIQVRTEKGMLTKRLVIAR